MNHTSNLLAALGASALFVVSGVACGGVGGGNPPDTSAVGRFTVAAHACGVVSATGTLNLGSDAENEPEETCRLECLAAATCTDIASALCPGGHAPACVAACFPAFACGDDTTVPFAQRCDGEPQCLSGSDEAGCPTFACGDGKVLPASTVCDGATDCVNGADEASCPTFACATGAPVPAARECDLHADCADGSDEHDGCARVELDKCPI